MDSIWVPWWLKNQIRVSQNDENTVGMPSEEMARFNIFDNPRAKTSTRGLWVGINVLLVGVSHGKIPSSRMGSSMPHNYKIS